MSRKVSLLALVICLFLALLNPVLTGAQSGMEVLESSAQAEFPSRISFNLSLSDSVNITDIRLRYTIERESFAEIVSEAYIEFTPATKVNVSWTLEMVKIGGLPPGSSLDYWWLAEDARGDKLQTSPAHIQFDDERYSWSSLTKDKVTLYWYQGNRAFADELMAASDDALYRLTRDTGAYLEKPVKIYVYATAEDLRGAMIYPQEWTGGAAFVGYGIIALGVAESNLGWGKGAIAHELAHLVVHEMTLNPYHGLPAWLDEGLAMYAEGTLQTGYDAMLNNAAANKNLISVRSLSSPFSARPDLAYLAYAQSYSLIEFLVTSYGQSQMLELLNTFKQGATYDSALKKVYGFDMDGLDSLWRDYIAEKFQTKVGTAVVTGKSLDIISATALL